MYKRFSQLDKLFSVIALKCTLSLNIIIVKAISLQSSTFKYADLYSKSACYSTNTNSVSIGNHTVSSSIWN